MSHFYSRDGTPHHFVDKKDGNGTRPATITDARKNGWLPGVTDILDLLDKPALTRWKVRQGVYAVATAPDIPGDGLDAKIERILDVEQQQDEESRIAKERGSQIHEACAAWWAPMHTWHEKFSAMAPWVCPALKAVSERGSFVASEKVLVGDNYAGTSDLILETPDHWEIGDFKSCKSLPDPKKGSWLEHRVQCSAYAAAWWKKLQEVGLPLVEVSKPIVTWNCYISTTDPGKFVIFAHDPDWQKTYNTIFAPLVQVWQGIKNYTPTI